MISASAFYRPSLRLGFSTPAVGFIGRRTTKHVSPGTTLIIDVKSGATFCGIGLFTRFDCCEE